MTGTSANGSGSSQSAWGIRWFRTTWAQMFRGSSCYNGTASRLAAAVFWDFCSMLHGQWCDCVQLPHCSLQKSRAASMAAHNIPPMCSVFSPGGCSRGEWEATEQWHADRHRQGPWQVIPKANGISHWRISAPISWNCSEECLPSEKK